MIGFIVSFVVVLALARSLSSSFQFYKAALVYFVFILVFGLLFKSGAEIGAVLAASAVKGAISVPYFYLLDRFEDSIVIWLLIFSVGFVMFLAA